MVDSYRCPLWAPSFSKPLLAFVTLLDPHWNPTNRHSFYVITVHKTNHAKPCPSPLVVHSKHLFNIYNHLNNCAQAVHKDNNEEIALGQIEGLVKSRAALNVASVGLGHK